MSVVFLSFESETLKGNTAIDLNKVIVPRKKILVSPIRVSSQEEASSYHRPAHIHTHCISTHSAHIATLSS